MAAPAVDPRESPGAPSPEPAAAPERFYRPELDGLRFLAFLAVFLHHALPQAEAEWGSHGVGADVAPWLAAAVTAGAHGVDLFFVLSSYLITELLLREQDRFGEISPVKFWARRALRIWPLYFAFLFLCSGVVPRFRFALTPPQLAAFVLMAGNWYVAFFGYPASVAAPLWSISVEEQFYVAWPWLVRRGGLKRVVLLSGIMIGVGLATRGFLWVRGVAPPGVWCNTFARLDAIALGALVAVWGRRGFPELSPFQRSLTWITASAAIVVVTRFVPVSLPHASVHHVWSYLCVDLAAAAMLVAALRSSRSGGGLLRTRALVYLGRISYGLYVWHALALKIGGSAVVRLLGSNSLATRTWFALFLTIGLASASYFCLERPFLKIKARFARVASRPD